MDFINSVLNTLYDIGKFIVVGVIFKYIIVRWVADRMLKWFTSKNLRNWTIWNHFQLRAHGKGHNTHTVVDCFDGNCAKL